MLESFSNILECEKELVSKTRDCCLIGETIITREDVEKLGIFIKGYLDCDSVYYLKHYVPACVSYFLVWKGIYEYVANEGNFWSAVENSLGKTDPNIKTKLGQVFFHFLEKNNLPLFELPSTKKYVTNILIHGTIPDSNLSEYFEKIIAQRNKDLPSTDIEGVKFF